MLKTGTIAITIAASSFFTPALAQQAGGKPDRALRAALHKGLSPEKAKCYADISRRYYTPGTLTVKGKKALAWKLELWEQCRIGR